jgi:hypothetical protein
MPAIKEFAEICGMAERFQPGVLCEMASLAKAAQELALWSVGYVDRVVWCSENSE